MCHFFKASSSSHIASLHSLCLRASVVVVGSSDGGIECLVAVREKKNLGLKMLFFDRVCIVVGGAGTGT